MGSSFLTTINLVLCLYSLLIFFKSIIQFGLPNHPARLMLYFVNLFVALFFGMKVAAGLGYLSPFFYMKWSPLLLVAGGLGLLLEVITTIGKFSYVQQKVVSRVPLIGALLAFAFFPHLDEELLIGSLLTSVLFLSISVGKARYQKRMFFKMCLFLTIFALLIQTQLYWVYNLGELFLIPSLFYFSIFQQSYGVSALVERFMEES